MDELKEKLMPCPFCGSDRVTIEDNSSEIEEDYIIVCEDCGCAVLASNDAMPVPKEELNKKWNMRSTTKDIPSGTFEPSWISVKDRLPENGKNVLAACKVKLANGKSRYYICDAFYAHKYSVTCSVYSDLDADYSEETDEYYFPEGWWEYIHNWDEYSSVAIDDFVTHWMPLPETPKEYD